MTKYSIGWKTKQKVGWTICILEATVIWTVVIVVGQIGTYIQYGCMPLLETICKG